MRTPNRARGLGDAPVRVPKVYSFHMVLSYSRNPFCCFTTSQDLAAFWGCHRRAFAHLTRSARGLRAEPPRSRYVHDPPTPEHHDWSDPNRIVLTTTDSNTWGGRSG